jgi:SAM-dependent methyltransferase
MKYIHEWLDTLSPKSPQDALRIIDIGAGTGRYSVPLAEEGYDVTAVELVRHNLGILKAKGSAVKAYEGNAMKLKRFPDDSFDAALLFGPMYHLHSEEEKLAALREAKRVVREDGIIFVAYIMNEYSVVQYAFKERHILEALEQGMLDESFHTKKNANELYSFMRIEDIDRLNEKAGLTRQKIIAADGAANYMRPFLNALTEDEFEQFVRYHLATCERGDLLGASAHTVDILRNRYTENECLS